MLGVSPNTLRSWERRFGFPEPTRTAGGHRQFDLAEIEALRAAFEETHNVSSAIAVARERGAGPASPARLRSAFNRFDEDGANRILEESLTVRSVERTVEEVLLPGGRGAAPRAGAAPTPEYGFAWRFATGWLAATQRVSPARDARRGRRRSSTRAARPTSSALHAQALELVLRRGGLRTLTLTADCDPTRLSHAVTRARTRAPSSSPATAPTLDALGRLVFGARRVGGDDGRDPRLPRRDPAHRREHGRAAARRRRWPRARRSSPRIDGRAGRRRRFGRGPSTPIAL